ncbi:MAG: hypothetical protein OJF49_003697 [Ktedonobacterales bacterium]|jgi:predicted nucleic acid-binding protein|nr:MAG: hypothetical protein OJF49_003697 [Ktedonobacterales bacterium]
MIVYVESNFILEIALGQEQSASAETILQFAEAHSIELAFPGFALSEPFATLTHRGKEQLKMSKSLSEMLRQLQRSSPHQQTVTELASAPALLGSIARKETDRLQETVRRLLDCGIYLQMDGTSFSAALAYQSRFGLSPQDSIIYATVIADLQRRASQGDKCFISRNWKDFRDPDILAELRSYHCSFAESFDEGLARITAQP